MPHVYIILVVLYIN